LARWTYGVDSAKAVQFLFVLSSQRSFSAELQAEAHRAARCPSVLAPASMHCWFQWFLPTDTLVSSVRGPKLPARARPSIGQLIVLALPDPLHSSASQPNSKRRRDDQSHKALSLGQFGLTHPTSTPTEPHRHLIVFADRPRLVWVSSQPRQPHPPHPFAFFVPCSLPLLPPSLLLLPRRR
jgi:hypothetical protein